MKFRIILFFAFLALTAAGNAQTDFRPGYIVKNDGDTIYGDIDYRSDILMGTVCTFRSADKIIAHYSPREVQSFRYKDSKYYVSREVAGVKTFVECLIQGKICMFYLRDQKGDHYFMEKNDSAFIELPYEETQIFRNGNRYLVQSKQHIGILTVYMNDAPDFKSRIDQVVKPEQQNLISLAKAYDNLACNGGRCIVFEKKPPLFKVNIEAVAGLVWFRNTRDAEAETKISEGNFFQSGVLLNFWMPRSNEKLYFKTGILYAMVTDTAGKGYNYVKIPTHLGYIAPNTYMIRPYFSIGILSPSYCLGVMVRTGKKSYLGFQGWTDFFPNENFNLVPKLLKNYSVMGSFFLEL